VAAVAAQQEIGSDLIPAVATAFCSGLAETGSQCGALSGGILALSMVQGRRSNGDNRELVYTNTRRLMDHFDRTFKARTCPDLIHIQLGTPAASEEYAARGLSSQCEQYIREVTKRTIELLAG
jgi:C_GCAxxG_C_C family probable redox protein